MVESDQTSSFSRLSSRLRRSARRVAEAPERVRTFLRLVRGTGIVESFTATGARELVRALASGSENPSLIYRIHGKNAPTSPALHFYDRTLTWGELDARIERLAAGLESRGIGRGKRILVMMKNRPEFVELAAAAGRIGVATVSISWRTTARELGYLATHSGAAGIVIEPSLVGVVDAARAELSETFLKNVITVGPDYEALLEGAQTRSREIDKAIDDDASLVIYTSGTTGKPKGAVRKFPKDTMNTAFQFINETPMRAADVHLVACPLYHSTAFGFLSISALLGAQFVLMDEFKAEAFLALVDRHRVTTTAVVPTMLRRILDLPLETRQKYDVRSLRAVFSGGAPLPPALAIEFMDAFGDILFNFYGATETGFVTLAKPGDLRASPGTIGKALPGNHVRLLDENQRDVGEGEVGELFVRNKLLVAGYHGDDEATRASMVDGFFSVGDLARRDPSGNYSIEGRKRDLVISGGVNVYPAEVEDVIHSHPDIVEAAVIGMPDPEWGERVKAFVVRRPSGAVDDGALKLYLRERLAAPKVPQTIVFLDSLPRNPTGKVLKRELRERG